MAVRKQLGGALLLFLATAIDAPAQTSQRSTVITAVQLTYAEKQLNRHEDVRHLLPLFLQASDEGSAAARRDLGLIYLQGYEGYTGKPPDADHALQMFEAAALAGDTRALSYVGDFYLDPDNDPSTGPEHGTPAPAEALFWYRKAEKAHDARGTLSLAHLYCDALGVKRDVPRCGHLLDEATALQTPSDPADVLDNLKDGDILLGDDYHKGDGVARNDLLAAGWYAKAAKLGSVEGGLDQALLYVRKGGLPQDLPRATALVEATANLEKQHNNFDEMTRIGRAYAAIGAAYEAGGVSRFNAAIAAYTRAAVLYQPDPLMAFAMRYVDGKGVPVDLVRATAIVDATVKAQQQAESFNQADKDAAVRVYEAIGAKYEADGGHIVLPHSDFRTIPGTATLQNGRSLDSLSLALVKLSDPIAYDTLAHDQEKGFRFGRFLTPEDFSTRNGRQFIFNGVEIETMDLNQLRQALADKVVIVGGHWHPIAYGSGDQYVDMWKSPGGTEPGAMLHANYVEAMRDPMSSFTAISERTAEIVEWCLALGLALLGALEVHEGWKWAGFVLSCLASLLLSYVLLQNLGLFLDFSFLSSSLWPIL